MEMQAMTVAEGGAAVAPPGVEKRVSLIPNAGFGLFATQRHVKGSVVCEYTGKIWPNAAAWKLKDKSYLMKLGDGKYVDARECPDVLARYINDCRRKNAYNVTFEKRPQEDKALVVALRDIEVDEELYVDYGRFYWVAYNLLHPDSPVR
ncbi:TPA: hypothetical protein N0F65_007050 [Lagenidium giganteum]|uniref:SET domain-containing protein n=1 Tax=Lagenidium giganteum TaxID=4803 RepID=A0AAV2YW81_9STRA|nr:TPA: hypothetical protein N0F65_007050 [Lagenidium giganteum]